MAETSKKRSLARFTDQLANWNLNSTFELERFFCFLFGAGLR